MKVRRLIDEGILVVTGKEEATEDEVGFTTYGVDDDYKLFHNGEEVLCVDVHDDSIVWVTTKECEFEYKYIDELPVEAFKKLTT